VSHWVGTSGWSYAHWRGAFYPAGLPARRELEHAAQAFSSLEINRSFYSLLTPASCLAWRASSPTPFVFALKGSRFITHSKKLRDVAGALANFYASGPLALGDKLGPCVWQLPATLHYDEARVAAFFASLPRTNRAAAELAQQHDHRVKHGVYLEVTRTRKLRHAIEPRHESFRCASFARLARKHGIAIVVADSSAWPRFEEITCDFMYVRLHGGAETYASAYTPAQLDEWARRIEGWLQGVYRPDAARVEARERSTDAAPARRVRDVYVYFDNDLHAHAPRNASELLARLASTG
jgi:uncharacterized protein YecE (DUF72 family)